jgi:hypothetical protein
LCRRVLRSSQRPRVLLCYRERTWADHMAKVADLGSEEVALLQIQEQPRAVETMSDSVQMHQVLLPTLIVHNYIIQVNQTNFPRQTYKGNIHETLKRSGRVL